MADTTHVTKTSKGKGTGLHGWTCSCGAGRSGYPDAQRAQRAAELHRGVESLPA